MKWSTKLGRRALGLALAVGMAAGGLTVGHADAISTYCVSVAANSVSVLHNNKVTHSFKAANANIAVANDARSGDLLVSFNDTSGGTTTMSFGQQPILLFYGKIGTLDLTSALNKPIVIGANCTVGNMQVNAPVKVSIWGKVNGGDVNAAANVIAAKGSVVTGLESRNTGANFFANAGSTVNGIKYQGTATSTDGNNTFIYIGNGGAPTVNENSSVLIYGNGNSSIGSNTNWNTGNNNGSNSGSSNNNWNTGNTRPNYITHNYDGGYSITATDMTANYYDQLGSLLYKLGSNVGVADKSGNRVQGTVSWYNNSNSTVVRGGGEFQFLFTPSKSNISPMVGTIRIITNGSGSSSGDCWYDEDDDEWYDHYGEYVDLDIKEIVIREDQLGRRLARFTNDLKKAVTAYNEDGREIRGTVKWLYNEKVEEPGWYEFVFIPSSSKYETVRDEVKIVLEKETTDEGTPGTGSDQGNSSGGTQTEGPSTGDTNTNGTGTGTGSDQGNSSGGTQTGGTGTGTTDQGTQTGGTNSGASSGTGDPITGGVDNIDGGQVSAPAIDGVPITP